MPTKIKTQNLLSWVISDAIPSSWDFTVTLSQAPTYTKWFIVFDVTSASSYESVYFHNRVWNVIYVKAENRPSPKAHSIGTSFQMNNTAELINYLSDNANTFWYVEKTWWLTVSVWWGNIYDSGTRYSVSDTSLTLPASQTNYIYLDTGTRTIKQTLNLVTADTGLLLATVVSWASSVSSISQEQPFVILWPAWDMDSSIYDPANWARQVAFACNIQSSITDYTFTWNEQTQSWYLVTTASNRTVNINADLFTTWFEVTFCKGTDNANTITFDSWSGNNINWSQTFVVTEYNETITLLKDWANTWKIKSHYFPWIKTSLDNKVDKVSGKWLSQEDYTTAEKAKLATLEDIKTFVTVGFSEADYICDGVADNVQIQQAIDAVTVNGGTILIKKGTYNFTNNIQLKSNVRLIWEWTWTILKAWGSHGWIIYQWDTIVPVNASVESMALDVNNILNVSAVQIYKFNKLTFRDVYVTNVNNIWAFKLWDYGADPAVAKSYALAMYNVRIENSNSWTREPIITVNTDNITLNWVVVKWCDLTNASYVSIFLLSKNVKITNCHFESATDDFWLLDLTWAENVTITWNTFIHTGATWWNAIVNRNTNNVTITWNTLNWKVQSWAGGNGIIILDWSWTIDWHTNPFPYTENLVISSNVVTGFDSSFNFSNSDASTNCWWSNITIANNQCTWFNYSFLTSRHVSGRNSARWNIVWNNIIPRSTWDKILMWFRATWSFQNTKLVINWNSFNPTTANNTTVFQFDKADIVRFGVNYTEARWTGTVYNLGTSTNVTYTTLSATP